ncbi:MAG: hypothetical protein GY725_26085 [bacterium]|nr:hypothetical protein [bacterium]
MSKVGKIAESGKTTRGKRNRYIALIADIVGSREIPRRAAVQKRLLKTMDELNGAWPRALVAGLEMTAGDEFEGLFSHGDPVLEIARQLSDVLGSVPLRVGLGLGTLSTPLPRVRTRRRVGSLDGSAFHQAREALVQSQERRAWISAKGFGAGPDAALSSLGELIGTLRGGWTDKQAQYVGAARQMPQNAVAKRFRVGPSVISESLKAARFEVCLRAENAFTVALIEFGKNAEVEEDSAREPNRR